MPHPTGHPERPSQRSPLPALQMRHRTSTLEPLSGSKAGSASGHFSLAQKATCSRRASRTAGSGQGGGQVGGRSWLAAISARAAAHQRRRSGRARVRSAQKKKFQNKKKKGQLKRPRDAARKCLFGLSLARLSWGLGRTRTRGAARAARGSRLTCRFRRGRGQTGGGMQRRPRPRQTGGGQARRWQKTASRWE